MRLEHLAVWTAAHDTTSGKIRPTISRNQTNSAHSPVSAPNGAGPAGPVVVVQVAGAIARTISNWVRVGDQLVAGQRLGVIHFGSRTDVLLPRGTADVLVAKGNRVHAGVTPLARRRIG